MEYTFNEAVSSYISIFEAAKANYELEAILEGADGSDSATDGTADTQDSTTGEPSKKEGCLALAVEAINKIFDLTLDKNTGCVDCAKETIGNVQNLTADKVKEYAGKVGADLNLKMVCFSSKFIDGAKALVETAKDATKSLEEGKCEADKITEGIDKFTKGCEEATEAEDFTVDAYKKACEAILETRDTIEALKSAVNAIPEKEKEFGSESTLGCIETVKQLAENLASLMEKLDEGLTFVKEAAGEAESAKEEDSEEKESESDKLEKAKKLMEAAMALKAIDEDPEAASTIDPKVFIEAAKILSEDTEYMKTSGTAQQGEPAEDKPEGDTGKYDPATNGADAENSKPDMEDTKSLVGDKGIQIMTDDDGCATCVECSFGF